MNSVHKVLDKFDADTSYSYYRYMLHAKSKWPILTARPQSAPPATRAAYHAGLPRAE